MKPIGLQLYSLRELAEKDFVSVLEKVAKIGYKYVEPAGLFGNTPKTIARIISELGMSVCSSHIELPTTDNINEIVDIECAFCNKRVITSMGPDDFKTNDACMRSCEKLTAAVELLRPHGIEFGYHNHWWEFTTIHDGKYVYDIIMENVSGLFSQLDTYWSTYGKADTPEIIKKYSSRIPLLHIKDGALENTDYQLPVGSGKLDFDSIVHAADDKILDCLIVELDNVRGSALAAVKDSYRYLTTSGLGCGMV